MLSSTIDLIAQIASIATALGGVIFYISYTCRRWLQRKKLEEFLKARGSVATLLVLTAALGMTESEIVDAAFRSNKIKRSVGSDMLGSPSRLLLRYLG